MLEGNTGITGNDENVLVSTQKSYHTMGGQIFLALIEAVFESPHPPF